MSIRIFLVYDVYNGVFYYGANGELLRVTGADADAPVAVAANPTFLCGLA